MLDFVRIVTDTTKKGIVIYPEFQVLLNSEDLMVKGKRFYAIWDEENNMWSTKEERVAQLVDKALWDKRKEYPAGDTIVVKTMQDFSTKKWVEWQNYVKSLTDNYHDLNNKVIFQNTDVKKTDYASRRLDYSIEPGDISSYNEMVGTLYSPIERQKLEWAIGAIICGDAKYIQKFMVLYGTSGSGKSTVLNIIEKLFEGYTATFEAKELGSATSNFALEDLKDNPLVAVQHDGDLSKIEDNTKLNSIVSHETMVVNEKFKSKYTLRFNAFLFMGTNKPVRITDAKSGIIRRLIDVRPSGNLIPFDIYNKLKSNIDYELGGIADHCLKVYKKLGISYYDKYVARDMIGQTNDFYNFVSDSYYVFLKEDEVSLKSAWAMYKEYCVEADVKYPYSLRLFKNELRNYFDEFLDRAYIDGARTRQVFRGFKKEKFSESLEYDEEVGTTVVPSFLLFKSQLSKLDEEFADCPAQYANDEGTPRYKWDNVKTTLKDLDTHLLHYVRPNEKYICIDFDKKDEEGHKSLEKNIEAAKVFKPTYAETSKSGGGLHLIYAYTGDVSLLAGEIEEDVEIKVFTGKLSMRRMLTMCNDHPITTISSGLPLKGAKKMVNFEAVKSEKGLRSIIKKCLNKEHHGATKPEIDFIQKILNDAYESGMKYDVSDLRNKILAFGANSSHQAEYCISLVNKMKFKSEDSSDDIESEENGLVFFDCEVFPNLFLVNWKYEGEGKPVTRMINPTPSEIEDIMRFKLVGFNCRRYDNHMLYARMMGYSNEQLYKLSQDIISGDNHKMFSEAYNVSYTDVYDFSSKKQSLKKFEIELGIHHKELGLPWDKPVPEERWTEVAEYCDNDVIATEAVFNARKADFVAREILADVAGMTVNATTNSLTTKIIFGNDRRPQDRFKYRNLGEKLKNGFTYEDAVKYLDEKNGEWEYDKPYFPGYIFDAGKSTYRGEEVGEGGYVYSEPGMYFNVALLDVASMHPHSVTNENLFGVYTEKFEEILDARMAIKHKNFELAGTMLDGKLKRYLNDESSSSALAQALKIAINSVYGLTAARFENPFRDIRNKDNIVAKRGALFMIDLKHAVQEKGYSVAHIKTDSIKIPNATPEIIEYVMEFGKLYGYTFEHEATYERMCLVNDAVYIAKVDGGEWTATGTQFAVPYVFKTLFSREDLVFDDFCETKSVSGDSAIYIDDLKNLTADELEKIGMKDVEEVEKSSFELVVDGNKKNPRFIGRVGRFTPMINGGAIYRVKNGKAYAVTGTKGYNWMESEVVKTLHKEDEIDKTYYEDLAKEAINTINKYGDFNSFVITDDDIPF